MVHCNQCGYDWEPMRGIPKACTKCKRYDWSEPRKGHGEGTSRVNAGREAVIEEGISGAAKPEPVIRATRGFESCPSPSKSVGVGTAAVAVLEKSAPVKLCKSCEEPLMIVKGKWVCNDQSCGLYGNQQGNV